MFVQSKPATSAEAENKMEPMEPNMQTHMNGTVGSSELREDGQKPRLLLMGLKRYGLVYLFQIIITLIIVRVSSSGKSSISNVVFRKMAPHETLFLEATTTIKKESMQ